MSHTLAANVYRYIAINSDNTSKKLQCSLKFWSVHLAKPSLNSWLRNAVCTRRLLSPHSNVMCRYTNVVVIQHVTISQYIGSLHSVSKYQEISKFWKRAVVHQESCFAEILATTSPIFTKRSYGCMSCELNIATCRNLWLDTCTHALYHVPER